MKPLDCTICKGEGYIVTKTGVIACKGCSGDGNFRWVLENKCKCLLHEKI